MKNALLIGFPAFWLITAILIAAFSQRPWQPARALRQPIPFSHHVHAGTYHIPCLYCHAYARRSDFAGVPPVQRCLGCHSAYNWQSVDRVTRPWAANGKSPLEIRWNRVFKLPDFVRFSHRIHVHAGVSCQECHGPIQRMDRVEPATVINMGFCIRCHTQRHVTRDCFVCHY